MTELKLTDLSRIYSDSVPVEALRHVNLTIRQGDFVAIEGPSGAGKSTLLNVLALLDSPSSGTYEIDGVSTSGLSDAQAARLRCQTFGFVFQSFHLLAHRSAVDNVILGLSYHGATLEQARSRALAALEFVGLAHRSQTPVERLSGGERQRVAIARAITAGTPVLLADEPTGNLDSASSAAIMDLLQELNRTGTTVVVVTHDPQVAARARRRLQVVDGCVSEKNLDQPPLEETKNIAAAQLMPPQTEPSPAKVRGKMMLRDIACALYCEPRRAARLVAVVVIAVTLCLTMIGLAISARYQVSGTFDAQRNRRVAVGLNLDPQADSGLDPSTVVTDPDMQALANVAAIPGVQEVLAISDHGDAQVSTSPVVAPASVRCFGMSFVTATPDLLQVTGTTSNYDLTAGLAADQVLVGAGAASTLGLGPLDLSPTVWVNGSPYEVVGIIDAAGMRPEVTSGVVMSQPQAEQVSVASQASIEVWTRPGAAGQVSKVAALTWVPTLVDLTTTVAPPDPQGMRQMLEANLRNILLTLTVVAVLAGLAVLSSAMNTAVQARAGEFALRRAIGARRVHLRVLVSGEAICIGLVGGIGGVICSTVAVLIVTIVQRWQPVIDPLSLPLGIGLGMLTGLLSALLAARRASKIEPAAALR